MIKAIESIVFIGLLIFSFFLGVRYSNTVKENISWLQTKSDEELELPNINEESSDSDSVQNNEGEMPAMDDIGENENKSSNSANVQNTETNNPAESQYQKNPHQSINKQSL